MSSDLRGKRKKKVKKNPNPLFTQWLEEWRDEAAAKGAKSQYTYNKALSALRKYPVPFASGKECKLLSHFGDKICKMLDDKLAKHIAEYGSVDYNPGDVDDDDDDMAMMRVPPPPAASIRSAFVGADSGSSDEDLPMHMTVPKPQRVRRPSGPKSPREYIPQYRSGPYALLITLNNNLKAGINHMLKKELMKAAQPLSEKSFTIPDPGCRYTAWSSMGTLIRKGFVIKISSPAKYKLTESGQAMAQRLLQADADGFRGDCQLRMADDDLGFTFGAGLGGNLHMENRTVAAEADESFLGTDNRLSFPGGGHRLGQGGSSTHAKSNGSAKRGEYMGEMGMDVIPTATVSLWEEEQNLKKLHNNIPRDGLKFWYVTEDGKEVMNKDEAAVTIDDETSVGFLIKASYDDLLMCSKRYNLDMTRPTCNGKVYAYVHNEDAENTANPADGDRLHVKSITTKTVSNNPAPKTVPIKTKAEGPVKRQKPAAKSTSTATMPNLPRPLPARTATLTDIASLTGDSQSQSSQSSGVSFNPAVDANPDFTLCPGSFEILLCVDNQEYYGKCPGREVLMRELQLNHVPYDIRKLQVGDFLWVARDKFVPKKELVLNYIIERKRMDDLAGSITDGRFKEQKFRLHNCGLDNQIYLVEAYGSAQHFTISEDALNQAITNTQVIDGFHVKNTQETKESAVYLTIMTRYLQSLYANKTLQACRKTTVEQYNKMACLQDREVCLMTFPEFSESSVKTKANSVQEMFGKQLLTIAGMTAEKAAALIDIYPTPSSLMRAYRMCDNDKEREALVKDIKPAGAVKRSIGLTLSKVLSILYTRPGPFS